MSKDHQGLYDSSSPVVRLCHIQCMKHVITSGKLVNPQNCSHPFTFKNMSTCYPQWALMDPLSYNTSEPLFSRKCEPLITLQPLSKPKTSPVVFHPSNKPHP
ncbi:hypothetical protein AMTR_s00008p00085640 [Amborella trichopoda]|uniref:Uncharacterized protein n=1 Tax=Amborella trichopoda TaxID=13333 RepID=W1NIK3_AMBTC|nr:hypothetical protein AMTR_s00008p00085640 [Amborella trichopoda]